MIPRDPCWDLLKKLAVSTRSMIWKNKDQEKKITQKGPPKCLIVDLEILYSIMSEKNVCCSN